MSGADWAAIKAANPIADIIGQAIPLTRAGNEFRACCPFHPDKSPSFHVIPAKSFAHCFGCGWHGDVVDFVAAFKSCSTADAIAMLGGGDIAGQDTGAIEARKAAMQDRDRQQQQDRAGAITRARNLWDNAGQADPHHPYLVRKGVELHTLRQHDDGRLLLPIYDSAGDIQSLQFIDDAGGKKFLPFAPTSLGRMYIGISMGRTILCEGFATGADIFAAVPEQVCVTYSMNNMEKVARELAAAGHAIVLAADTGTSAERMAVLARELHCPLVVPTVPTDFNDMRAELGGGAVADVFRASMRAFMEAAARKDEANRIDDAPVDLWAEPQVPELPRGLLPPLIERFAVARSEQMGTDPGGMAISALVACASVIDDAICIKPKQHEQWTESARLWAMMIGAPSSRKSPIMKAATRRVKSIDRNLLRQGQKALADWQEGGGQKGSDPRPETPRLRIEDVTMEAAQEVCKHSPRGIMAIQDELQGWFGGIEKYAGGKGGGKDRSFWLQAYGGGSYAVDRVGRGSFLIENLSVSILGGVQPDTIRRIMQDATDDGLIQRFIPIILRRADPERDIEVPAVDHEYEALIDRLHDMKPSANFFGVQPLQFDDDARAIREEMSARHYRMVNAIEGFNPKLSSHIGKYDGLFPRLCVVWHCVEHALSASHNDALPANVSVSTARRVADFLTGYIMRHSMAFYAGVIGLSDGHERAQMVGAYILAHKLETVTLRTIERGVREFRALDRDSAAKVMDHLEAFGWLVATHKRSDAPSWAVRPEVHEMFAAKADMERERRSEVLTVVNEITSEYERP